MKERYIYLVGAAIAAVLIPLILSVMFPAKTAAAAEDSIRVCEESQQAEMPAGYPDELSAMPCCNVVLKEVQNEQETGEERTGEAGAVHEEHNTVEILEGHLDPVYAADVSQETAEEADFRSDAKTASERASEISEVLRCGDGESQASVYLVNGESLSPYLQDYLYSRLEAFGIAWFFETALCQIYQESRFDAAAENPNGLDKGLCQFRIIYFPAMAAEAGLYEYDVFNPIDSIYVYTYLMGKYLTQAGGDVGMALSLYHQGEGGAYDEKYVNDVTQWNEKMEVKK